MIQEKRRRDYGSHHPDETHDKYAPEEHEAQHDIAGGYDQKYEDRDVILR